MSQPNSFDTSSSPSAQLGRPAIQQLAGLLGPFIALAAVVLIFAVADQWLNGEKATFLTGRNLTTITAQTATVAVAALGMTVVIISGGIDLSAGTAIALCATVLAWCLKEDIGPRLVTGDTTVAVGKQLDEAKSAIKQADRNLEKLADRGATAAEVAEVLKDKSRATTAVEQLGRRLKSLRTISVCVAVPLAIGCGCLCGLINGMLVSFLRVVPFIVTLGTMQLYLGLSKQLAHETTVRPDRALQVADGLADLLSVRADALWFGLPSGVWLTLLFAVMLAAVLRWTVFSRYVFALGSNEATARLCGINVRWNKIAVYMLGGLFVGIAGLYQFSRLTVGNPTSGSGLELKIIAAVVIGGGSLSGGRGTVIGTLTGALIMSVITSGCTMLGLQNPVQDMILGVIIVAAVTIDQVRQRRMK